MEHEDNVTAEIQVPNSFPGIFANPYIAEYFLLFPHYSGKGDRNSKNQPEQLWPFPMYLGLQLQLKDPSVLAQVEFSLQL